MADKSDTPKQGKPASDAGRDDDKPKSDKAPSSGDDNADEGDDDARHKKGLLQRPILLISAGVLLVVVLLAALIWWLNARNYESTDDAFIDTHIIRLAPQISGRVSQVLVTDNALVKAGQPLVIIDSADYATRVAQAQAQRAQAQAQVDNALAQIQVDEASYLQARADVASAQAQATKAAQDLARYQPLRGLNAAAVSGQQLDQAESNARQTAAQRDSAQKAALAKAAQITAARTQVSAGEDQVKAADAQLNEAGINLGYARLTAPEAGHVAQKSVALGNYLQAGTEVMAIVPLKLWVTANFKETQLDHMRPGQPVTIKVDACPSSKIKGRVDSIQRGAGQAFAILPAENATGKYVKVVQRVPVKIDLEDPPADCPLGPGLSVTPTVRIR